MAAPSVKLILHMTVWLLTEIVLNLVGLDTLANYGEFVFDRKDIHILTSTPVLTAIVPPSCPWLRGWQTASEI